MDKMVPANEMLRDLMAELILDNAIREYKQKILYREIDKALAQGDEAAFLTLTSELRALLSSAS